MSISPFADYSNAEITFTLPGVADGFDSVGNRKFATGSSLVVAAMLTQNDSTRVERLPGVSLQAVYLAGRVTGLIMDTQPVLNLAIPDTVKNEMRGAANWGTLTGEFIILRRGRSPFGVEEVLGDRLQGWFEIR
ncbi:MAG: hypothetical protein ICV85_12770 [Tolypothrix sp. T3-bin4]|nr:hypothetical protein [Tolypothrix sp. Co-bin9]MBD0303005.1 hypothetical protein [Tolypothrix sp. T3-bin4]